MSGAFLFSKVVAELLVIDDLFQLGPGIVPNEITDVTNN